MLDMIANTPRHMCQIVIELKGKDGDKQNRGNDRMTVSLQ